MVQHWLQYIPFLGFIITLLGTQDCYLQTNRRRTRNSVSKSKDILSISPYQWERIGMPEQSAAVEEEANVEMPCCSRHP